MTLEAIEQAVIRLTRQEKLQLIEYLAHSLRQPDESSLELRRTQPARPDKRKALDDPPTGTGHAADRQPRGRAF